MSTKKCWCVWESVTSHHTNNIYWCLLIQMIVGLTGLHNKHTRGGFHLRLHSHLLSASLQFRPQFGSPRCFSFSFYILYVYISYHILGFYMSVDAFVHFLFLFILSCFHFNLQLGFAYVYNNSIFNYKIDSPFHALGFTSNSSH